MLWLLPCAAAAACPEVPLLPLVRSSASPDGRSLSSRRCVGLTKSPELPSREDSSALRGDGGSESSADLYAAASALGWLTGTASALSQTLLANHSLELGHNRCKVGTCLGVLHSRHSMQHMASTAASLSRLGHCTPTSLEECVPPSPAATTIKLPGSTDLRPAALHQASIRLEPFELRRVIARQLVSRRHVGPPAVRHKAD